MCQNTTNRSQGIHAMFATEQQVVCGVVNDRRKEESWDFLRACRRSVTPWQKKHRPRRTHWHCRRDKTYRRVGNKTSSTDRFSCVPNFGREDNGQRERRLQPPGIWWNAFLISAERQTSSERFRASPEIQHGKVLHL